MIMPSFSRGLSSAAAQEEEEAEEAEFESEEEEYDEDMAEESKKGFLNITPETVGEYSTRDLQCIRSRFKGKIQKSRMKQGSARTKGIRKMMMKNNRPWQLELTDKVSVIEVELVRRRISGEIPADDKLFRPWGKSAKVVPHPSHSPEDDPTLKYFRGLGGKQ